MSESIQILIVDDDPSIRRLCNRMLTRMGHGVEEAGTGGDALRLVETRPFQVVLLDLNLPDGSGYDWSGCLRSVRPGLAVVYFTGAAPAARARGENEQLTLGKPFTPDSLREVLERALDA